METDDNLKGGENTTTAKIIEIIGSSRKGWEDAVKNALKDASGTLRNITGIELVSQTAKVDQSKGDSIIEYRSVIKVAFAYETE